MTNPSPTPKATRHLRILLLSLALLLLGLGIFVFAVSMESTATAEGEVTARGMVEVRAPQAGRIELCDLQLGAELRSGTELAAVNAVQVRAPEGESPWLLVAVDVASGQA